MAELIFMGKIVNGIGRHSELVIPGRSAISNAPDDWPEKLCPGSLNLRISQFPGEFATRGLAASAKSLDAGAFAPVLIIPQAKMLHNRLSPTQSMPQRGTAQVWRAQLSTNGRSTHCWILRRIGSGLSDQIELVSGLRLREALALSRMQEWPARLTMEYVMLG